MVPAWTTGGSFSVTSPFGLLITRPAAASSEARRGRTRKVTSRPPCSILPPKYPPMAPAPTMRTRISQPPCCWIVTILQTFSERSASADKLGDGARNRFALLQHLKMSRTTQVDNSDAFAELLAECVAIDLEGDHHLLLSDLIDLQIKLALSNRVGRATSPEKGRRGSHRGQRALTLLRAPVAAASGRSLATGRPGRQTRNSGQTGVPVWEQVELRLSACYLPVRVPIAEAVYVPVSNIVKWACRGLG